MLISAHCIQNLCRLIFMKHMLIFFPDINMFFSNTQKYRYIRLGNDMTFPEYCIFRHPWNDLCDIMTQNLPDGVFGFH